jgi:uncharacterized protein (TIGR02452 family)
MSEQQIYKPEFKTTQRGINRQFLANETIQSFTSLIQDHYKVLENVKNTKYYTNTMPLSVNLKTITVINVINSDTISLAKELVTLGLRPLVLNMANENHPGGGWIGGALAQEEDLFLCSTYDLSLNNDYFIDKERTWSYPIKKTGAIYSPGVLVFRNPKDYSILPKNERYLVDFIAAAAICSPKLSEEQNDSGFYFNEQDLNLTLEKIRTIFRVALLNNHSTLLLGAFGCGAFRNNPYDVANCFKQVLNEHEFKNVFKNIYFGIIDNKRTNNFSVFKQILEAI